MTVLENEILNLLVKIEMAVGELYKVYARKFPEYRRFWSDIVKEEENHAGLIKGLKREISKGHIRLNEARCSKGAVETVLNYIEDRLERAQERIIPIEDVFQSALQIEKNVIEKDFCSFFDGDSEEFKKVCEVVMRGTSQHRNKIEEVLSNLRQQ